MYGCIFTEIINYSHLIYLAIMKNVIIYISAIKCGEEIDIYGFHRYNNEDILNQLNRINHTAIECIKIGIFDNYRILHICSHGINCSKFQNYKNVIYINLKT